MPRDSCPHFIYRACALSCARSQLPNMGYGMDDSIKGTVKEGNRSIVFVYLVYEVWGADSLRSRESSLSHSRCVLASRRFLGNL